MYRYGLLSDEDASTSMHHCLVTAITTQLVLAVATYWHKLVNRQHTANEKKNRIVTLIKKKKKSQESIVIISFM